MRTHPGLHALVRSLAATPAQRLVVAAAIAALVRQRRQSLVALAPWLAAAPFTGRAKLDLWQAMGTALAGQARPAQQLQPVLAALQATDAYAKAQQRQLRSLWFPCARGHGYRHLLDSWRGQPPQRLLIFHHHDRRGWLPRCWLQTLLAIRRAGWTVVVSSSDLRPEHHAELEAHGVAVALRANLGRCLGAYKDVTLLLQHDPALLAGVRSLVFCNDSTLPIAAEDRLLQQVQAWAEVWEHADGPVLAGLTDSAERGCYHLQSFLLYANAPCLQHPAWQRFWLGLSPFGSKDALINAGEIGLSQAALAAGVELQPAYPLVQGLLEDEAMADELQRFGISQPRHVNQSLFAWQSLLARGCPLVKKHVLFDLLENQGQPMALASLARWIPAERRALVAADLQELFVSRYAFTTPEAL